MTKSQLATCIRAFYDEIKESKGNLGNPNVVLYRKNNSPVQYNPCDNVRMGKTSLVISGQEIAYSDIRGVNFFFDKEGSNLKQENK